MKEEKVEAIEDFIKEFDTRLESFEYHTSFIRSNGKKELRLEVLRILKNKSYAIKSAKNKKQLKKHINMDALMMKIGEDDE